MQNRSRLFAELVAIVIGVPLLLLAVAALRFLSLYALAIGVLGSAGLGFHSIKRSYGSVPAITGALVIAAVVLFSSLFLIANIIGE